jgi:hypothetical protein
MPRAGGLLAGGLLAGGLLAGRRLSPVAVSRSVRGW